MTIVATLPRQLRRCGMTISAELASSATLALFRISILQFSLIQAVGHVENRQCYKRIAGARLPMVTAAWGVYP
jgi:hypothetical protein